MKNLTLLFLLISSFSFGQTSVIIAVSQGQGGGTNPPASGDHFVKTTGNDSNPGTEASPFLTIGHAESVSSDGDVITVFDGTYRESITVMHDDITIQAAPGNNSVYVSGVADVGTSGWSVYSGSIYRKAISLPTTNYNTSISTVGQLMANQIWKDGVMEMEASEPDFADIEDFFVRSNFYDRGDISTYNTTTLITTVLPSGDLTGAGMLSYGWFIRNYGTVTADAGTTYTISGLTSAAGDEFRQRWAFVHHLLLLDSEGEHFYDGTYLYYHTGGAGSPTGLTYKSRSWIFDLSNRDNVTIKGINAFGARIAHGNSSTTNCTIDGRKDGNNNSYSTSFYPDHQIKVTDHNYGTDQYSGIDLGGTGNEIRNMHFKYSAGTAIWAGEQAVIYNCKFDYTNFAGNYGAAMRPLLGADNITMSYCSGRNAGRSLVDLNYGSGQTHNNITISYCDFGYGGMLNADLGMIYTSQDARLDGTVIDHCWLHHNQAPREPGEKGIMVDSYYGDQHSGSITMQYCIVWGDPSLTNGSTFHQADDAVPASNFYNCTLVGGPTGSYIRYADPDGISDVLRNNNFVVSPNYCNGGCPPGSSASNNVTSNFQFVGGFSEDDGRKYQVGPTSSSINAGVVIPGVTPGSNVTAGGYQFGGDVWVPGVTWD